MPSVLVHTLGCKLNQLESEAALDAFLKAGYVLHDTSLAPSVVLINTCTVTSKADQKARRIIRKTLRDYPDATVIVTGCYAALDKATIENFLTEDTKDAEVQSRLLVLRREEFLSYIKNNSCSFVPFDDKFQFFPEKFISHTRSFLKIQDGCDKQCTYCRIRLARGKSISLSSGKALERLRFLEENYSEAVLTGVNICQYRDETCKDLAGLLEYILEGTKEIAIRLSSLSPESINERLCKVLKNERIKPHFHLSIQSASEGVLNRMGRTYNKETIENAIKLLRSVKDDPFLACDIIAGFPGETQKEFETTYNFYKMIGFSWIHVFPYSKRPGTLAWSFSDCIEEKEITRRVKLLSDLASSGRSSYVKRWLGREVSVLVEKNKGKLCTGVTDNYLKVIIQCEGDRKPSSGTVLRSKLIETNNSKYDAACVIK